MLSIIVSDGKVPSVGETPQIEIIPSGTALEKSITNSGTLVTFVTSVKGPTLFFLSVLVGNNQIPKDPPPVYSVSKWLFFVM